MRLYSFAVVLSLLLQGGVASRMFVLKGIVADVRGPLANVASHADAKDDRSAAMNRPAQTAPAVLEKHRDLGLDLLEPQIKMNIRGKTPLQPGRNLVRATVTCEHSVSARSTPMAFVFNAESGRSYKVFWRGKNQYVGLAGPLLYGGHPSASGRS